jgi:hypothetical protein
MDKSSAIASPPGQNEIENIIQVISSAGKRRQRRNYVYFNTTSPLPFTSSH